MPRTLRQAAAPMKQLPLFSSAPQIASFAPEPPRNPDPPPSGEAPKLPNSGTSDASPRRSLSKLHSEGDQAKCAINSLSAPSTLRDKLMERRKREQRQRDQ